MSAARLINCPSCGGSIAIKAAGYSTTVACQYCGSELDVASPDVRLITEYHRAASAGDIALGARGTVAGTEWEVIGRLERSDDGASWTEYLLFNPYAGYRWLIQADDEWSFGMPLNRNPVTESDEVVSLDGQRYFLDYDPATTRTNSVVGEFYWRVRAGDEVQATTFSSGSTSLSWERSADEVNWTLVESLPDGDDVRAAFMDPVPASPSSPASGGGPRQFGRKATSGPAKSLLTSNSPEVRGLQPVRRASDYEDLSKMVGLAIATSFLLLVLGLLFGTGRAALSSSMTVYAGQPAQTVLLGTVTLKRPYQAVTIKARGSPFVNKWIDLDYSLVDRRTQRSIDAYGIIEYYSGRDSDGNWTEGSRTETTKFAGVPAGTYDVMVDVAAQKWVNPRDYGASYSGSGWSDPDPEGINIRFEVRPNGVFFSNVLMFILLTFAPIAIWMARRMHSAAEGYRS